MRFIDPSVEIITEPDLYKRIEIAARTCYKSEDKTTDGSAEKMVRFLLKRGHMSPLEHSNIVLECASRLDFDRVVEMITEYETSAGIPSYLRRDFETDYISGNYRAWLNFFDYYQYTNVFYNLLKDRPEFAPVMPPNEDPCLIVPNVSFGDPFDPSLPDRHRIITARFTCDRGVSHELVRHRCLSHSQTSTRYVRYDAGNMEFINPWWFGGSHPVIERVVTDAADDVEKYYVSMMKDFACAPQQARCVLPNMLKTEVVSTGTVEQWKRFVLPLRLSSAAHPDIRRVMELFCDALGWNPDDFRKRGE